MNELDNAGKSLVGPVLLRSEELGLYVQPGLEVDLFKPRLKSGIFKCISLLKGSLVRGR
jgi:hypothetical protein